MLPGGFESVLHLKYGVGDDQLVFCTERKEPEAVVVHLPNSVLANYLIPYQVLYAHSGIKISHEDEFVCGWCYSESWQNLDLMLKNQTIIVLDSDSDCELNRTRQLRKNSTNTNACLPARITGSPRTVEVPVLTVMIAPS